MIKYFTNRALSKALNINLARWKRWSREFLPPDPLGGLQSGYARQYHPDQAFTVFLGGNLVGDLKFSIPDARQIMKDLKPWLSEKGFFFGTKNYSPSNKDIDALVQRYILFIIREKGIDNHFSFSYTARGIISKEPVLYKGFEVMKKLYVETFFNSGIENDSGSVNNVVKTLHISAILKDFVDALGLDQTRYPALSL